jgi:probable HAF family extracellular repeat protein
MAESLHGGNHHYQPVADPERTDKLRSNRPRRPSRRGSVANGINDHTDVVGFAGFPVHAFQWRRGKIVDLGTLGGPWSAGWSINNSGEVAGAAELPPTQDIRRLCQDADLSGAHVCRAFLWRDGVLRDLGTFGGMNSVAFCINDRHEVVGAADTPDSVHAFIWEGGSLKDLGTRRGIDSACHAINNRGQVAIDAHISRIVNPKLGEPDYHAFFWDRGIFTDLRNVGRKREFCLGNERQRPGCRVCSLDR